MSTQPAIAAIADNVLATFREAALVLRPPPKLSVTEWAEANFVLSSEDSAVTGPYRVERAPFQREILDCITDPEVEEVVLQCAAQMLKTLVFKIWIAYFVKEDPSSIIFVLPDIPLAKRVSRQRLAPMFRDVPILQGLLEQGANKAGNATLEKSFPGGVLFLVGANSPAGLASVPVRILLADEVNRYPVSAGSEGDPLKLAEARTSTFWNAKKAKASTPTDEFGAITRELEGSDWRQYYVPCPHCSTEEEIAAVLADPEPRLYQQSAVSGQPSAEQDQNPPRRHGGTEEEQPQGLEGEEQKQTQERGRGEEQEGQDPAGDVEDQLERVLPACYQVLTWERMVKDYNPPHTGTVYACEACGAEIQEKDKAWMNARGRWVPRFPEVRGRRGYQISALYSPFTSWAKLTEKFAAATKARHNPEVLKAFVNLDLAEPFTEASEALSSEELMGRCEHYPFPLPEGVCLVTAAVDVQHDRLEFLARGWGLGQESWLVDRKVFVGDTSKLLGSDGRPSPWQQLDEYHERWWTLHARGVRLPIYCMFVDSGDQTTIVNEFTKPRQGRWIYSTKGVSGFDKPVLGTFARNNRHKARLYLVGVDAAKSTLHRRLRIGTPGAGYVHFSRQHCDTEYFQQLTAEQIKWKMVRGFKKKYWEKAPGRANEALDLEVLAYAALLKVSDKLEDFLAAQRRRLLEEAAAAKAVRAGKAPDPNQLALDVPVATGPEVQTPAEPASPPAAEAPPGPPAPARVLRAKLKF